MRRYDPVALTGKLRDFAGPYDRKPSQMNHYYERTMIRPYGRQLRGLGGEPADPNRSDSWAGDDDALRQGNDDDDAVGNGIFDGDGAAPVQHANAGIFQAHYAEPGFLYRERLTRPGQVVSTVTNRPMVFVPAGGGDAQDMAEAYAPFDDETQRSYTAGEAMSGVESEPSAVSKILPYAVAGIFAGAMIAWARKEGVF